MVAASAADVGKSLRAVVRGDAGGAPPEFGSFVNPIPTRAQCFKLKLRWRFCVHASTWPEFYFLAKF